MTNKEAIEILKAHISIYDCCKADHEANEAINLAIKALEEVEEWNKLKLICANEGIIVYKVRENGE